MNVSQNEWLNYLFVCIEAITTLRNNNIHYLDELEVKFICVNLTLGVYNILYMVTGISGK